MNGRILSFYLAALMLLVHLTGCAQGKVIQLPEPQMEGGMPLMEALANRQTLRSFSNEELSPQLLSNLLWAAFGVNRPDNNMRTAPSARNMQEIDIYVVKESAAYLYNPFKNQLELIVKGDHRAATGLQEFVVDAPINLVFVSDYDRMGDGDEDGKRFYSATDTGFISQNVYLFCASEGLATVVRGWLDRDELRTALNLADNQHVVLAQTVGYLGE